MSLERTAAADEDESYVDVRSLPLRPPQRAAPPERATRRPWHPVMWDSSIIGVPPPNPVQSEERTAAADEDESYVDVRSLPLRPPQRAAPPERATRRPWHPVMWDSSIIGVPPPNPVQSEEDADPSREYPHKQRIRNLRRLIAEGKVKPTPETLIFFLCNKFAVSEERQNKISM